MQIAPELLRRCWFLAGPTACGKSEIGVELARRIDAEIVSLDSMALYRGMDIGTAKPSAKLRAATPHHLIDLLDVHEEFSVADYVAAAERVCRGIVDRGRTPLFVGGTGLYLRSLLRGVFDGPAASPEVRRSLAAESETLGADALHDRLRQVDPASARALHPRDVRRVIRALEVHTLTGRPLSEQQRQSPLPAGERPRRVFWLSPPRVWLYDRIGCRVESMVSEGLADEVRRLLTATPPLGRIPRQALGYKEMIEHLEGRASIAETVARIQTRTRQFAKRQHTWFRHLEECRAVDMSGEETPPLLADRILAAATEDDGPNV